MKDATQLARDKIRGRGLKLVLPEGDDERIVAAARILKSESLADPIVLQGKMAEPREAQVAILLFNRPKLTTAIASRMLSKPFYFGGSMVATGSADAMLGGVTVTTAKVIEAALITIGLAVGQKVPSSFFLMQWPGRQLLFADCAVNVQPSAEELAGIAEATVRSSRLLVGLDPRVAMLSFSTLGSAKHEDVEKVQKATALLKQRCPELLVDGEIQLDAALSPSVAARKMGEGSVVRGDANVLVFPDLDAGNIGYKIAQYLGGAKAIGPVLQGFARPVSDLSRGATIDDIVATATLLLATCD